MRCWSSAIAACSPRTRIWPLPGTWARSGVAGPACRLSLPYGLRGRTSRRSASIAPWPPPAMRALPLARDRPPAAPEVGLPEAECLSYLRDNLEFHLGPRQREGLERFYQLAKRNGLAELQSSRHTEVCLLLFRPPKCPSRGIIARKPQKHPRCRSLGRISHEQAQSGNQPLPLATCGEPRRLAALGPGSPPAGPRGTETDLPVDRLFGLSLVPRDGPRELREPGHRRRLESRLHQHQGRSRGAAGPGPDLYGSRAGHERPGRVADVGLPHARAEAVLRRHVLAAARAGAE